MGELPADLTAATARAVLETLGQDLPAEADLAEGAALVPSVSRLGAGAWAVRDATVHQLAGGAGISTLLCSCDQPLCAHAVAVALTNAWEDPVGRRAFLLPPWEARLDGLLKALEPEPQRTPHLGEIRYHLQDRAGSGLPSLEVRPEIVRFRRSGSGTLEPVRYPTDLSRLRALVTPLLPWDLSFHETWWALERARHATRTSGSPLLRRLLEVLNACPRVFRNEQPVRIHPVPLSPRLVATPEDGGLGLTWDPPIAAAWCERVVCQEDGVVRPLDPAVPAAMLDLLGRPLPRVPQADVGRFVDRVMVSTGLEVTLPQGLGQFRDADDVESRLELAEEGPTLVVRPRCAYHREGRVAVVVPGSPGEVLRIPGAGAVRRDRDLEAITAGRFAEEVGDPEGVRLTGEAALDFLSEQLPDLKDRWAVYGEDGLIRHRVSGTLSASVGFTTGVDWFDLDLAFVKGPIRIGADDVLRSWWAGRRYLRLDDASFAKLPQRWLERHVEVVGAVRTIQRAQDRLGSWAAWMASELLVEEVGEAAKQWIELAARLRKLDRIPAVAPPAGLQADLRPYQLEGVSWACFLRDHGLGGVLADEMGLGKTAQALAVLLDTHAEPGPPSLVVAPTSVLATWRDQARRFAPSLKVTMWHGPGREMPEDADVVLTTYSLLWRDTEVLGPRSWRYVVLDEAQLIKNPGSKAARAARRLKATHRLALTGTPLENHLLDLWSVFTFLMPGFLGSRRSFHARYAGPAARDGDAAAITRLRDRIAPFLLRRKKVDVAKELPPRTESVLPVQLGAEERRLYELVRDTWRARALRRTARGRNSSLGPEEGPGRIHVLEALMRLRQACCHPALLPFPEAQRLEHSSKLTVLVDKLEEVSEAGHRSLVFSQWPSLLDKLEPMLEARAWTWMRLDGSTQKRDHLEEAWNRFDGPPFFLISTRAGGTGLNLAGADHVFLLDPWWNPALEAQAADRAHRIGQTKPVFVYRLVAEGTVEEQVLALQAGKRKLAIDVLAGGTPDLATWVEVLEGA